MRFVFWLNQKPGIRNTKLGASLQSIRIPWRAIGQCVREARRFGIRNVHSHRFEHIGYRGRNQAILGANGKIWNQRWLLFFITLYALCMFSIRAPQRGCLFADDFPEKFAGRYKRSDCVVNCRIASIVALCNCLIFYLPISQRSGAGGYTGIPTCTLEHVQCLNHYRSEYISGQCERGWL